MQKYENVEVFQLRKLERLSIKIGKTELDIKFLHNSKIFNVIPKDVRCLIHRAFKIGSSDIIFHNELEKIKILLPKNMYPKSVIDNQIKTFQDKQFAVDSGTTSEKQKTLHYSLPYIGHFSHVTKKN